MTTLRLFDAHNHLQDERFGGGQEALLGACRRVGVESMVVNGSGAEDWAAVASLARAHPGLVIPSFGVHPWYVHEQAPDWQTRLRNALDELPSAVGATEGLP